MVHQSLNIVVGILSLNLTKRSRWKVWDQSKSLLSPRKCSKPEDWVYNPNIIKRAQALLEGILKNVGSTEGTTKTRLGFFTFSKTEKQINQKLKLSSRLALRSVSFGEVKVHLANWSGKSQIMTIRQNVCRLHPFTCQHPSQIWFLTTVQSTFQFEWKPVFNLEHRFPLTTRVQG